MVVGRKAVTPFFATPSAMVFRPFKRCRRRRPRRDSHECAYPPALAARNCRLRPNDLRIRRDLAFRSQRCDRASSNSAAIPSTTADGVTIFPPRIAFMGRNLQSYSLLRPLALSSSTVTSRCSCRMDAGHFGSISPLTIARTASALPLPNASMMTFLRAHDAAHAQRDGLLRHVLAMLEEALVRVDGGVGQVDHVSALVEHAAGLVEADVAVVADAQNLHVDAASSASIISS